MRKSIPATLLIVGTLACASVRPGSVKTSASTLAQADSIWARNYMTHDTTTALRLMSDDFYMTSSNGRVKDRATEIADIRPAAGLTMQYFRTEDVRVRDYGDAGVVTGTASWAFDMNGRSSSVRRRYTAMYKRGGSLGWELVALHMGAAPQ